MPLIVGLALGSACAPHYGASAAAARAFGAERKARADSAPPGGASEFAERSASPEPAAEDQELAFCGQADAALSRVALRVARRDTGGQGPLDALELAFAMRAEGEPHVWPHSFTLSAPTLDTEDIVARVHAFLDSFAEGGIRRCGIARSDGSDGRHTIAVVVVDAFADLKPLPTRGRVGQWMRLEATLLVPATVAKLVVLAPTGMPRTVPTTLHGDHVEATFALDRTGPFNVQLLASPSGGPRPVLEAMIFADTNPPREVAESPAPGEVDGSPDDPDVLYRMVNAARATESVAALARNEALDRVASAQAAALERLGRLAHDAGEGDPVARLHRAGLSPRRTGENVAHAATMRLAHRLLWESPSHRGNLLDPHFDSVGVGAVRGADGSVWVCEIFADFANAGIDGQRRLARTPVAGLAGEPFSAPRGK